MTRPREIDWLYSGLGLLLPQADRAAAGSGISDHQDGLVKKHLTLNGL